MGPGYDVIMLVLLSYGIDMMSAIGGPILQMPVSCALANALCSVSELLCDMSCVCKDKLKVTVVVSPTMDTCLTRPGQIHIDTIG